MTQRQPNPDEATTNHAASLIAKALQELQRDAASTPMMERTQSELQATRVAIQELAQRLEHQLTDDRDQRLLLAGQLASLAGSLDKLVTHLEGLSGLMGTLLERLVQAPAEATPPTPTEPSFAAGGEGVSLSLIAVPGFQALMDIQKALSGLEEVAGASVERFQEGDSRMLVHLNAALGAQAIADALHQGTGYNFVVEESKPELARLRLKFVAG